MSYDQQGVEDASRALLEAVGEDINREGLRNTPARMGRAWRELLSGLEEDPREHLKTTFEVGTDEIVMVRDIPFYSVCEHHLLPFYGHAHVGYIPKGGRVTGLSKLARVVEGYARRPQVQERLTAQIADAIDEVEHIGERSDDIRNRQMPEADREVRADDVDDLIRLLRIRMIDTDKVDLAVIIQVAVIA